MFSIPTGKIKIVENLRNKNKIVSIKKPPE